MKPAGSDVAPMTEELSCRLLILDDFFPNLISGFRVAEFNSLFRAFPRSRCASISPEFLTVYPAYANRYPEFADRISFFGGDIPRATDLVYCVGLNTLEFYRPFIELRGVPFVLELYPGFGMRLDDAESDRALDAAIHSQWFRKVIVTQAITFDYVQRRFHLPASEIVFKYCGVFDDSLWPDHPRRPADDAPLRLGFVANKYRPGGLDKGYDVFIDAARRLKDLLPNRVRCHIVGPWGPGDRPLGSLRPGRDIFFHGYQTWPFFSTLYSGIDAVVSPNRAHLLGRGSFDGFPTAAVVDAMACGVAAFLSDPMSLNHELRVGREFVLIESEVDAVVEAIMRVLRTPGEMARIGERGRLRVRRLFDLESQMAPRIAALSTVGSGR